MRWVLQPYSWRFSLAISYHRVWNEELELDKAEHFTDAAGTFVRFGLCELVDSENIFINIVQLLCEVTVFVFKPYNFVFTLVISSRLDSCIFSLSRQVSISFFCVS